MNPVEVAFFWFRRDLRLEDNVGLFFALKSQYPVIPLFIFDEEILDKLPKDDARVGFIHESLSKMNDFLKEIDCSILIKKGKTMQIWQELISEFNVKEVFFNKDYEPYAIQRDLVISEFLALHNINHFTFKDQVIFEELEIVKSSTGDRKVSLKNVLTESQILAYQDIIRRIPVAENVLEYAVTLVAKTRHNNALAPELTKNFITWGAGPRASQNLIIGAKCHAALNGKYSPDIEDVKAVAVGILRHRVVKNYKADAEGISIEKIIDSLL